MSRLQRLSIWLAAAAVTIGSLGVPLSAQRAVRSGEPFPCQNCPCGCTDAETCWRDCCCNTNAEKVAWAQKYGVKVPVFVLAAARREQAALAAKPACCRDHAAGESCEGHACSASGDDTCTAGSCCSQKSPHATEADGKVVLLITALKCRGISVSIGLLPPSVPLAERAVDAAIADLGPLVVEAPTLYIPPSHDVATPPPDARELLAS